MSTGEEKLQQFMAVTGANPERAEFFLASANGNLELALAGFYDNDEGHEQDAGSDVEIVEQVESVDEPPSSESQSNRSRVVRKPNTRFATIHTLNNAQSSDEDGEEGQAFYAGGSEHSGQQVLGPRKTDVASEMLKTIKEHGIEVESHDSASTSSSRAFRGTGYKLGATNDDSVTVQGASEPSKPVKVILKLWKEGFSVNDGELRYYSDPANKEFLSSIQRGEIPRELRNSGSEVDVTMEDHRGETYQAGGGGTRSNRRAFTGQGHTLGSPTPPVVGAPMEEDKTVNENNARKHLNLDSSQPTTNIQIRLADGSRLVGQFNHTNTIGDVRSYIVTARPQYQTRTFSLLSAYPTRELKDSMTLAEADVLNSAIIQKLT